MGFLSYQICVAGEMGIYMRITQSSLMRNYISNLRGSISNLSKSNEKLTTMSKYTRASDNTSATARAFVIREQIYKNEQYLVNIDDADGELSSSESSLRTINDLLKTVNERALRGINGTMEDADRKVIAQDIENMKGQIMQSINVKFGSRFLFANSNNSEAPFSTDSSGQLTYNGITVKDIFKDVSTGKLMYPNPSYNASDPASIQFLAVPENKDIFIDIGLGMVVSGGAVDRKSALQISTSGIEAMSYGEDNIYDLLTSITNEFRTNDMSELSADLDKLQKLTDNVMLQVTDIGSRTSYIEQTKERINTEIYNLKAKQDDIEAIDIEYEAINNKSYEMAWMINLQLGSKIIPPSIFDFMK
jgi:flagellin-like hook-associated protein FlgL